MEAIPESRRLDGFQDDDEDLTDEQKHAKIRGMHSIFQHFSTVFLFLLAAHSQKLAGECKHEVITLKRNLMRADKVEEILPIARAIRDLMPVFFHLLPVSHIHFSSDDVSSSLPLPFAFLFSLHPFHISHSPLISRSS